MTNPEYVVDLNNKDYVIKNIPKYNLTQGLNEKKYRMISDQVIDNIPRVCDWLNEDFLKKNNLHGWNESVKKLHKSKDDNKFNSPDYRRIVFDEILSNF